MTRGRLRSRLWRDLSAWWEKPQWKYAPGDKVRGPLGYQIPKEAKGLRWIFKDVLGSGRVVFEIKWWTGPLEDST